MAVARMCTPGIPSPWRWVARSSRWTWRGTVNSKWRPGQNYLHVANAETPAFAFDTVSLGCAVNSLSMFYVDEHEDGPDQVGRSSRAAADLTQDAPCT